MIKYYNLVFYYNLTVSQRAVDYSELIVKKHFMSALN
jgi:hypothetical protein